ncbi:hypothetical protein GJQ57_22820 [Ralstonia pickettii]|uniref:Uncharacterized protein n=1 Tax=Ralstonia pickettii TaxID=329 RepID=A0A7X2LBU4_RALPI|nr:hypothetical protein [Ralstonia pickettii]
MKILRGLVLQVFRGCVNKYCSVRRFRPSLRRHATGKKSPRHAGFFPFGEQSSLPLYCKQDIFIFYIQWLIFLLIGNTMKNTMLRKGLTIF